MRSIYRISALAGAILLPICAALATGIPEASAATGDEFCLITPVQTECLNAWGGGPYVNVETNPNIVIQSNLFKISYEQDNLVELQFVGGGPWSGECIGDAKNLPGNANASLNPCGTNGANAGWGTQFSLFSMGTQGDAFYDSHWSGFLGPLNNPVNGSPFYLNKPKDAPLYFTPSAN
jgi:hypothetical protein